MTKFEEELFNKVPCKFELTTEAEYKKSTLINHFKNWHSDEEFQELLDKYSNLNDNCEKEVIKSSKLESQIVNLKSQLQQQALPVVQEFVAGAIESIPDHYSAFEAISLINTKVNALPEENEDWLPVYNWLCEGIDNQDAFALAFITGEYEVEKPQLFEVKMPIVYWDDDASQLTNGFAFLRIDKETDEVDFVGFSSNTKKRTVHFTEQEIKSIDERYWQFAVPMEDGQ